MYPPLAMNALDIILVVLLAVCLVYGLWRGFVHIAVGIAGFGIGLATAFRLAEKGPAWFSGVFSSPAMARIAAFTVVLVLVLILTALAIWLGGKLIRAAGIGWMDRVAGGIVGLAGGLVSAIGIALALTTFVPPGAGFLRESKLLPMLQGGVDLASGILPTQVSRMYQERRAALNGETGALQPSPPVPAPTPAKAITPKPVPAKPSPSPTGKPKKPAS